jgi:hypothetical protein
VFFLTPESKKEAIIDIINNICVVKIPLDSDLVVKLGRTIIMDDKINLSSMPLSSEVLIFKYKYKIDIFCFKKSQYNIFHLGHT